MWVLAITLRAGGKTIEHILTAAALDGLLVEAAVDPADLARQHAIENVVFDKHDLKTWRADMSAFVKFAETQLAANVDEPDRQTSEAKESSVRNAKKRIRP